MCGCNFPLKLERLKLSSNLIEEIKKDVFPEDLLILSLNNNNISYIEKKSLPNNLCELNINGNFIDRIEEDVLPKYLKALYINNNLIVRLKENTLPLTLENLSIIGNLLYELPLHLLDLRRLRYFHYINNPIEFIPLLILRWIDRIDSHDFSINNRVYSDNENIHNSNIQKSFRNSLENLMKDKVSYSLDECKNALLTSKLSEEVKREILNYCDDKTEHCIYLINFEELFHMVINRILIHKSKDEIFKILNDEMKDSICKCFTGRLTRLLNALNGFYPDIQIQIGSNEQITNVILMLKDKYEGDELKDKVRAELKERGYEENVIEEWVGFIE